MNRNVRRAVALALVLLMTIVVWPLASAARTGDHENLASSASLAPQGDTPAVGSLPPSWAPPSGIEFHQTDLVSTRLSTTPELSYMPSGTFGAGIYGAREYLSLDPDVYPIVGGHRTFYWDELEPVEGQFDFWRIHNFINAQVAQGKKAAFGISTYGGDFGGLSVPDWFVAGSPGAIVTCFDGHQIPMYWNSRYLTKYGAFVAALGQEFDGNPAVSWVQIGTGLYGENQPSHDRYDACLQGSNTTGASMDSLTWFNTSNAITDLYLGAFEETPVLFQFAPVYLSDWTRKEGAAYAAGAGAGLMHDGLVADREKAYGSNVACNNEAGHWDPIIAYNGSVPIAFESYLQYLPTATDVYWGMLNGLAKHADYINVGKCLLNVCDQSEEILTPLQPRTENFPIMRFTNAYLGKTLANTPSVWVALRETELAYCPDTGNFEFWLYQDDSGQRGQTVPAWNVGSAVQGRYTRRTDQATLNDYMYFDIDDAYIYGGTNEVEVTVRYLDQGFDDWQLEYHSATEIYDVAGVVNKTNSGEWLTATFSLDDAQFANGQSGGNDFRINSLSVHGGDEYIHMVDVSRAGDIQAQIELLAGPNLVSLPVVPVNSSLESALASLGGNYTKVYAYIDGGWKQHIVGAPPIVNTLGDLTEDLGFWIYMSAPDTLLVGGAAPAVTEIELRVGANLVGYPRSSSMPTADALSTIAGQYNKVYAYMDGGWKQYIVGAPPIVNTLTTMEPGYGYWIYATEPCTWTVTN